MPPAAGPDEANWNLGWAESFSWFTDSFYSVSYYDPAAGQNENQKMERQDLAWGGPNWRQLDDEGFAGVSSRESLLLAKLIAALCVI